MKLEGAVLLYGPDIHVLHKTSNVIVVLTPAGVVCYHSRDTGAGKIKFEVNRHIATNCILLIRGSKPPHYPLAVSAQTNLVAD
jgi:hypothetical protein